MNPAARSRRHHGLPNDATFVGDVLTEHMNFLSFLKMVEIAASILLRLQRRLSDIFFVAIAVLLLKLKFIFSVKTNLSN